MEVHKSSRELTHNATEQHSREGRPEHAGLQTQTELDIPMQPRGGFKVSQPTNEQRQEQGTGHPPPSYLQAATAAVPHASHTTSILGSCRAR